MLTARQLYFEAVKVGDELPPLVKPPVDRLQIARWVGAAGDFNPLFLDEPHARQAGFPSVLVPWMIAMGFVAELGTEWVRGARLKKFGARFVKIVWPGDVLTARGRVSDRRFEEGGRYGIDLEVWAENQRGELVVRGVTTWQLYYSAEDEARQRAGQAPLVVTREEEEARLARLSRAQPQRAAPQSRPLQPPRPVAPPTPPQRQPGPSPAAIAALAGRGPAPIVKPAPAKPPQAARKPEKKAKRGGARKPAAKRSAGKAKAARPRPAKRAEKKDRARARVRPPARKPSGKKRR